MIYHVLAAVVAFLAGVGVSAGTFAFILVIGVVPRIMGRMEIKDVMLIENVIVLGVVLGNISSTFEVIVYNSNFQYMDVLGHAVMILYGISTGVFVGCIAVALAEILHTFPILFRRFNLNKGLKLVIFSMAIGKVVGCIYYFLLGYAIM